MDFPFVILSQCLILCLAWQFCTQFCINLRWFCLLRFWRGTFQFPVVNNVTFATWEPELKTLCDKHYLYYTFHMLFPILILQTWFSVCQNPPDLTERFFLCMDSLNIYTPTPTPDFGLFTDIDFLCSKKTTLITSYFVRINRSHDNKWN